MNLQYRYIFIADLPSKLLGDTKGCFFFWTFGFKKKLNAYNLMFCPRDWFYYKEKYLPLK